MRKQIVSSGMLFILLLTQVAWAAESNTKDKVLPTDGSNSIKSPYFKLQYPVNAKANDPHVELHVDERFMYGRGTYELRNLFGTGTGNKETMYYSSIRSRFWLQGIVDEHLKFTTMIKDERSLRKENDDTPAYIERVYANYNNGMFSSTFGRFYYWIDDGNVFEDLLDGVRVKYGNDKTYAALSYGRTRDYYQTEGNRGSMQGYILRGRHRMGKFEEELSYYNFKKQGNYDSPFSHQKIFSARTRYYLGNASSVGWEYLNSKGEGNLLASNNGHGMVWSLNFGDEWANPSVKNSYCVHLRYYDQPRSSFIRHTMSGYPNIFSNTVYGAKGFDGFKGWGLYSEYIVIPGVQLTLEAYLLKNKGTSQYAESATEKIIAGSVNFYF